MPPMPSTAESERLAIINDLIARYLSGEIDRRQFSEWVAILRLSNDWPDGDARSLLMRTAIDLYWFRIGDWPEDTLKASLAFDLEEVGQSGFQPGGPMVDAQMLALLRAGYAPPGATFTDSNTEAHKEQERRIIAGEPYAPKNRRRTKGAK